MLHTVPVYEERDDLPLHLRAGTFSSRSSPVARAPSQKAWSFSKPKDSKIAGYPVARVLKTMCGNMIPASSVESLFVLGSNTGMATCRGSGTRLALQNLLVTSLAQLPGTCPKLPALAKAATSSCSTPSSVSRWANQHMVVAAMFPWAHKDSNPVARALSARVGFHAGLLLLFLRH